MAIPIGVIFMWSGTNATIPSGWERETTLDGKFPKGIADGVTNPNVTGGSATHTHTSPTHTHTMSDHTHTVDVGAGSGGGTATEDGSGASRRDHIHPQATSGNISSYSVDSVAVTYGAVSNNPPYKDVIFIKPTTATSGLPNEVIALSDDSGFANNTGKYNGYYKCDGQNGTPDYDGKFIRGATTGGDGGGTGGSYTNVHNIDHTHTQSHNHNDGSVSNHISLGYQRKSGTGPSDTVNSNHTHTVSFNTNSDNVSSSGLTVTTTETVQPYHKLFNVIQNRSNSTYTPIGIVGLWLGTLANIPSSFELLTTYYGSYIKFYATISAGTTGGSNTHTHSDNTHSHSFSHNHTGSINGHTQTVDNNNSGYTVATNATVHGITINSSTPTLNTATTSADSSNNEPEYVTVAYIKYKGDTGGSFLLNLI